MTTFLTILAAYAISLCIVVPIAAVTFRRYHRRRADSRRFHALLSLYRQRQRHDFEKAVQWRLAAQRISQLAAIEAERAAKDHEAYQKSRLVAALEQADQARQRGSVEMVKQPPPFV
jgi:predicted Zn-dependent protease